MTEPQDPDGPVELRASDADRERVVDRLREAAADGRITMDELDERLQAAYTSTTHAELRPLTRDLATSDAPASAPTARELVGGIPGRRRRSIVVMSGLDRRGRWVVPARFSVFAFWGGVQLDLREAILTERETVIRADAVMAGIEIRRRRAAPTLFKSHKKCMEALERRSSLGDAVDRRMGDRSARTAAFAP
jgi:hypothetical protein